MKETIIFVHGICHGAWCWEPYFIPYFEQLGYRCIAITLPGHEEPGSMKPIHFLLEDYLKAIVHVVDTLEEDPIIIGHSMGGMILQRYLLHGRCKKAVLMSSVPTSGVLLPSLRVLINNPGALKYLFQANLLGVFKKYPNLMLGPNPNSSHYANMMCAESFWAYLQLLIPIGRIKKGIPTLVMGGMEDQLISVAECQQTANKLGAEWVLMEGGSHDLMLDIDCSVYVDVIHHWIVSGSTI
jgi:pimeloyl-ACP methyl ester carboxylesterase